MNLLVYALLAQGGILMLGIVMWLAMVRREVTGARELALLALACMGWIAADMLGVFASDTGMVRMLAFAGYPFIAFTPVAWLSFALTYTGRGGHTSSIWFRTLLGLAVVTTVVSLTGSVHKLLYLTDEVVQIAEWMGGRPAYAVRPTYGPWFWIHGAASWWATAAGSVLIVSEHMHAMQSQKRISRWIAASALLPLAVNFVYVLRLVPMVKDLTPISLGITISVMSVVLFRYRLSDVRPFRRSALVDALQEAVLVLDERGRVTDFNPAMRRILDLDESDLARPLIDRTSRDGLRLPDELIAARVAGDTLPGASAMPPTVELRTEQGVRRFEYRSTPLSDPDQRELRAGRVILLLDVTEREQQRGAREQAEEALRQANAELLSRNDSLDQFAHTVAHDLKSPANTLRNYVHLLREDGDMPDSMRLESLNAIDAVSAKLMSIVDEMLLLAGARRQPVVPLPVAMEGVVDEALERLEPLISERGAYVKTTSTWPTVWGHAPWVEEVWVNYVSNALKYGGSPPRIVLGSDVTEHGHVRFWVQDNGSGIPHVDRDRLFVPFARLHAGGIEGHGLGLAIVRQIVERLGGTCGIEDSPLGGTTFYFTLPPVETSESVEA